MEDENEAAPGAHGAGSIAPALISVHPRGTAVVVAVGATLRVADLERSCSVNAEDASEHHGQAIKTVTFNKEGNLLASAGDDKLVKIWDTRTWACIKTISHSKKVTSVAFSQDSEYLLFADKFGAVFVQHASKEEPGGPFQMLAHCCSIITDLKLTSDGKHIITCDRDYKIRVSVFPAVPAAGAHEIRSYCLGHTSFVTCLDFVGGARSQQLLISGSGDGTVRLWDYKTGELWDTFVTVNVGGLCLDDVDTDYETISGVLNAKLDRDEGGTEDNNRAVVGVSVSPAGSVIAVIIERLAGVILLKYDGQFKKLNLLQVLALAEQVCTTSVEFDARGQLWLAAGAAAVAKLGDEPVTPAEEVAADADTDTDTEKKVQCIGQSPVVLVRLITNSGCHHVQEEELRESRIVVCNPESMPLGQALLQWLQRGSSSSGRSRGEADDAASAKEVAVAAEAAELAMKRSMTKRQYSVQQREDRKRLRNDKKLETGGAL